MGHVEGKRITASAGENGSRYPRGWARNAGFTGWKIAVAVVMILGVPVAIWLLMTFLLG